MRRPALAQDLPRRPVARPRHGRALCPLPPSRRSRLRHRRPCRRPRRLLPPPRRPGRRAGAAARAGAGDPADPRPGPRGDLLQAAAGATEGTITLHVNSANPTVSTASLGFVVRAATAPAAGRGRSGTTAITVPCLTLDSLIRDHGRPAFLKIDVEGFEDRVLMAALGGAVPALSFEFTTIGARRRPAASIGSPRSVLSLRRRARRRRKALPSAAGCRRTRWRRTSQPCRIEANSGDVYAVLNA